MPSGVYKRTRINKPKACFYFGSKNKNIAKVERICLKCGISFRAIGKYNRLCHFCTIKNKGLGQPNEDILFNFK